MSTQKQDRRRRRTNEKTAPRPAAPEVVYTQPKPFRRRRFMLQLLTVLAVVIAVFMGISVFFQVEKVMVVGADKLSVDEIAAASGIKKGDSLLFFGESAAAGKILAAEPYVRYVTFDIKLPGTVTIIIEEIPVVYAIKAHGGNWWLMSSDGKLTEQIDLAKANQYTRIQGVELMNPAVGEQATAYEPPNDPGTTQPVTVLAADRLDAALAISKQLEANQIFGKVSSVQVLDIHQLELFYGGKFQVKLGDSSRLDYKLASVKQAAVQLENHADGVIDASYTSNPNEIVFTPFDQ